MPMRIVQSDFPYLRERGFVFIVLSFFLKKIRADFDFKSLSVLQFGLMEGQVFVKSNQLSEDVFSEEFCS